MPVRLVQRDLGARVRPLGAVTPSLGLGTIALLGERGRVTKVRRVARAAHDACLVVSA